ncbi:hypothetical protein GJ496_007496 [Pomphorhynchus laevis]|nr:hypothetical protein GJ496_007496 [Pomphorhynchus laevis]
MQGVHEPSDINSFPITRSTNPILSRLDATSILNSPMHNSSDPSGSSYVERSCDQPASSDIESTPKPESFVDHSENQRPSTPQNYLSNETLKQKCDKLDLQQHTGCNNQGACKGVKVKKEQINALAVDLSSTEMYVKGRRNRFVDREQCLIFANMAESIKPNAQGRLDEEVIAIRSLVSNLFAIHEADLVKTLRVYSLFRLGRLVNFDFRIKTLYTIPEISGFAVAYTNARSMLCKFDDVSEWHSDIPDCIVRIPGYQIFRSDRSTRKGGGVALFIGDQFNAYGNVDLQIRKHHKLSLSHGIQPVYLLDYDLYQGYSNSEDKIGIRWRCISVVSMNYCPSLLSLP